jgi:hypothetical protein
MFAREAAGNLRQRVCQFLRHGHIGPGTVVRPLQPRDDGDGRETFTVDVESAGVVVLLAGVAAESE